MLPECPLLILTNREELRDRRSAPPQIVFCSQTGNSPSQNPQTDRSLSRSPSDGTVWLGGVDLEKGGKLWSYKTGGIVAAPPTVADGRVYVGSDDGLLYALDAKTGELRWTFETDSKILASAACAAAPNGDGSWILVGSYDNTMYCVDAATGGKLWSYETGNYINGAPAVSDGRVVFGGCDQIVHVVSLTDGKSVATIDAGAYIAASAAVADGLAYVGHYDGELLCVNLADESIAWRYGHQDGDASFSSPAVGKDRLVFGSRDERVHCVRRRDGKKLWTFRTGGNVDSSPVICGDKVIVGSDDGRLYLLRLANGKKVWSYELGDAIVSSPAVAAGMVIIGCDDGHVYAFGAKR